MCGIVGAIREKENVVDFLISGLQRLEYRGYDSSGIAVLNKAGKIERVRRVGRVALMEEAARTAGVQGSVGIGHTRWATHGGVTEPNAHPHVSNDLIAVVHNGIVENYEEECARLQKAGYVFESQTDTEVIAHAVHEEYLHSRNVFQAVQTACKRFRGAYAIVVMAADNPQEIVVARMGCPLLVALGENETLVASDVSAVISRTRSVVYLEDGDIALLKASGIIAMVDHKGEDIQRDVKHSSLSLASLELGPYSHFMQKEIHEQPKAVSDTAEALLDDTFAPDIFGKNAAKVFSEITSIKILACGTSYYAGLTAKYWLESIARMPTDVEIASEYRYRDVIADERQLIVTISQSGET
ncbi:MAG: glutamine--fructose-6-phosphate transaminase (isomerizing), partial [Eubacteriales bacterium]|nr:glutamine--fructose-6-phosphate transaminase (isomerizing) [Eubacteriales bacterium]